MQTPPREITSFGSILQKARDTVDAVKLKERFIYQNPSLTGIADNIISDYFNFFALNAWNIIKGNGDRNQSYSPDALVDLVWHLHILDVKTYYENSIEICGELIHHYIDRERDSEMEKLERRSRCHRDLLSELKKGESNPVSKSKAKVIQIARSSNKMPLPTTKSTLNGNRKRKCDMAKIFIETKEY